jgi:predicted patatin/cPLA2 family phospholipase
MRFQTFKVPIAKPEANPSIVYILSMNSEIAPCQNRAAQLYGINPGAVIELVKSRAGLPAPPPSTGRKLALLVEGGGMRGVCSAGGLVALDAMGFRNVFDQIYATSAGAMNVAYMLAGQAVFGIQIYYKEINNDKFINFRRLRKVVDIDFIFDRVVTQIRPLNTARVLEAPCEFLVSVLDKDSAETVVLRTTDYPREILSLLKATTALPVVYNRSVQIGSRHYIDGGLGSPVPLDHAIQQGCTDLLVFLTRPPSYISEMPEWWERRLFSWLCSNKNAMLQRAFERSHEDSNTCRDICMGKVQPSQGLNIATFCPAETGTLLTRLTRDGRLLKNSAVEMALATLQQFGGSPDLIADLVAT